MATEFIVVVAVSSSSSLFCCATNAYSSFFSAKMYVYVWEKEREIESSKRMGKLFSLNKQNLAKWCYYRVLYLLQMDAYALFTILQSTETNTYNWQTSLSEAWTDGEKGRRRRQRKIAQNPESPRERTTERRRREKKERAMHTLHYSINKWNVKIYEMGNMKSFLFFAAFLFLFVYMPYCCGYRLLTSQPADKRKKEK